MQADPHWDELIGSMWKELGAIPLDIDWDAMQAACRAGTLAWWAAKIDGEIVGWIEFTLGTHYHYGSTKFAWEFGHWCLPQYRPWVWIKLWRSALLVLQDMGVDIVVAHTHPRYDLEPVFVGRFGFEPGGQIFEKALSCRISLAAVAASRTRRTSFNRRTRER